jgi:ADP-ribosyl-[dinitrogen reductase] hydrolase
MSNVLLGTAIGDALGMPFETMLCNNPVLLNWDGTSFLPSEHHNLKAGQWTDDCQMSQIVTESLISCHGFNPDDLAQRYLAWIKSGNARGFGKTTLMAMQNLDSGRHWSESGIAGSYGNGSAMRAAPFGVYFRNDLRSLVSIVKMDSAITHVSDDAEAGAIAIAVAAYYAVNQDTDNLLEKICEQLPICKVRNTIYSLGSLIYSDYITPEQALRVLGTRANVQETVPAALYCFLKFDNYMEGAQAIIRSGGDTDTNCSIFCALYGAKGGTFSDYHSQNIENKDKLMILDSQLYNRTSYSFFPRSK